MRPEPAVLAAAGCLLAAGCGQSASPVNRVVDRFQRSLAAGDGPGACRELASPVRKALSEQQHEPCARAVLRLGLPRDRRSDTSIYLTSALARTRAGGTMFLDRTRSGWRVSAAGCTPTGPGLPYDCSLED
jgi:hypothetical protein